MSPRALPQRPSAAAIALDALAAARDHRHGILARQRARLTALLQAAAQVPRHAAVLARHDPHTVALDMLPVSNKSTLMREFDAGLADRTLTLDEVRRFCADPGCIGEPLRDRYWVWESSGSSGQPGVFVQDETAMAVYDALEAQRRDSPRPWWRTIDPFYLAERFAFVGATSGHFASQVSMQRLHRRHPWWVNWRSFSILQPIDALAAQLDDFGPTLLATYPTAALLLAERAAAGRLAMRPMEIWTGGETLTPAMRARIETVFDAPLRNSYGASEFLPIAWECGHGALHVNADWVILEPVDARHRPVPAGQASHTTLLTNLANHLQPLIRFDIGDSIVLDAAPCACGSALPTVQVQGRCDDMVTLPGARGGQVTLLPLALVTLLEDEAGVFDFELHAGRAALELRLGGATAAVRQRCKRVLAAFLHGQGVAPVEIDVVIRPASPPGRSGKVKRIVAQPVPRRPH